MVTKITISKPKKRYYPDGKQIPNSLPSSYQSTDPTTWDSTSIAVPLGQSCKNCISYDSNLGSCAKYNALVRSDYWCLSWKKRLFTTGVYK